jgi:hypothetical protein
VSFGLAAVFAVIAFGVFTPALTRPLLVLAMVTDPNTGPLLVLLAMAYWPQAAPSRRPSFAVGGRPDNRLADTTPPGAQIRPGRYRVQTTGTRSAIDLPGGLRRYGRTRVRPVLP